VQTTLTVTSLYCWFSTFADPGTCDTSGAIIIIPNQRTQPNLPIGVLAGSLAVLSTSRASEKLASYVPEMTSVCASDKALVILKQVPSLGSAHGDTGAVRDKTCRISCIAYRELNDGISNPPAAVDTTVIFVYGTASCFFAWSCTVII
jgi:hypothetical protein